MNHQTSTPGESPAPLPRRLMLALAGNMHAMQDYARLSDAGRERLIAMADAAKSQEEVTQLVQHITQFS